MQISWQAQHFVNLHVQISWQVQHFVNLHVQISWQAQHFVNLHVQISWQVQHFVNLHVQISWKHFVNLHAADFVAGSTLWNLHVPISWQAQLLCATPCADFVAGAITKCTRCFCGEMRSARTLYFSMNADPKLASGDENWQYTLSCSESSMCRFRLVSQVRGALCEPGCADFVADIAVHFVNLHVQIVVAGAALCATSMCRFRTRSNL